MWFYTHVVLQSFPTSPEKAMGYKKRKTWESVPPLIPRSGLRIAHP